MSSPAVRDRFHVHYQIRVRDQRSIEQHAADITIEQTVEVPVDVIPEEHFANGIPGRVESIAPLGEERFDVVISYRCDLADFSVPQLFNLLYGNISLKDNIRITGLDLPHSLLDSFNGPLYGIEGIRRLVGIGGRPLACCAIKPLGLQVEQLARIAGAYAAGGADLIKDDHGLGNQSFHPFAERVARCQEAITRGNAASGNNAVYFPMVSGGYDILEQQVRTAVREGVRGVLVGPMLVGLDAMRHLAREYDLAVMAHPALTGTFFHDRDHGMTPAVLLGSLFRLIGADVSIFPNAGGRFHFSDEECVALSAALRSPLGELNPAFPCPAGGLHLGRVPELFARYGPDTVILVGGDVLRRDDIESGTREFMDALRATAPEQRLAQQQPISACEWREPATTQTVPSDLLRFSDYTWSGRDKESYKHETDDFKGIMRQELTGRFGEETAFDLRYFEIEPGGHSSLEKHLHEHVVIGVRGEGVMVKGGQEFTIAPNDIAYVRPLEVHQLQNRGGKPFGFYCIVDHHRDRPRKP